MTQHLSRRIFLSGLLTTGLTPLALHAAPPETSLRPRSRPGSAKPLALTADKIIADANLSGEASFAVFDLNTNRPLEAKDPTKSMPPASVAKALTSLYALDVLGAKHRFETRVLATGDIVDGTLNGDLILAGGGDPTLQTNDLADLAALVKQTGILSVKGRFLVWGGALPFAQVIDSLQPDHVGYNPAVSGMALNFNRVHFEWKRAGSDWGVSMDARSDRYRPDVTMSRMRIVSRDAPVYTYDDTGGRDDWTVARTALGNGGSRWLPVRKPELYAGEVFQTMMRAQGIVLAAPEVTQILPSGQVIARKQSQPLPEILRDMLKFSTNLTAEMIGMAASARRLGRPETLVNSAAAMSDWAREVLNLNGTEMVDHSGLGDASRTTTGDLVRALNSPLGRTALRPLMKSIPMRDKNYRQLSGHPLDVVAKTGTLNFVSTLAGYANMEDGTDLAFAILTADVPKRDALTEGQRERPPGGRTWNRKSRLLQQAFLQRWSLLHAT